MYASTRRIRVGSLLSSGILSLFGLLFAASVTTVTNGLIITIALLILWFAWLASTFVLLTSGTATRERGNMNTRRNHYQSSGAAFTLALWVAFPLGEFSGVDSIFALGFVVIPAMVMSMLFFTRGRHPA